MAIICAIQGQEMQCFQNTLIYLANNTKLDHQGYDWPSTGKWGKRV